MSKLFQSRKFLLVLLDAIFGLAVLFVGFFVADVEWQKFTFAIFATLQPVFVAIILGIAVEDAAALKKGTHISQKYVSPK